MFNKKEYSRRYREMRDKADPGWAARKAREWREARKAEDRGAFYAWKRDNTVKLRRKYRKIVLEHYSNGKCECCGEAVEEFLEIDHINGDGAEHRRRVGIAPGVATYRYLIKNNFPPGFRVLCSNCNMARAFYSYCPHEIEHILGEDYKSD